MTSCLCALLGESLNTRAQKLAALVDTALASAVAVFGAQEILDLAQLMRGSPSPQLTSPSPFASQVIAQNCSDWLRRSYSHATFNWALPSKS